MSQTECLKAMCKSVMLSNVSPILLSSPKDVSSAMGQIKYFITAEYKGNVILETQLGLLVVLTIAQVQFPISTGNLQIIYLTPDDPASLPSSNF